MPSRNLLFAPLALLLLLAACQPNEPESRAPAPAASLAESWDAFVSRVFGGGEPREAAATRQAAGQLNWAWDCEDGRYLVTSHRDGALWLFLPQNTVKLEQVRAASGAKYQAGKIVFWTRGQEAMLEEDGGNTGCVINRGASVWEDAKLRGADFRAVGNEPGWHLELFSSQPSVLVTDYGQRRLVFELSAPAPMAGMVGTRFSGEADGATIGVTLTPGPCQDTMADLEYETRVEVRLDGQVLTGCGRALH